MAPTSPAKKLTNAQMALLELFNLEMSDRDVEELRRLLMKHYRTKLEAEVEQVKQRTSKTTAQLEEEMSFDNRSARLQVIRQRKE